MSGYTPKVKFQTTFDGDVVNMELSRLKRIDWMKLKPYLGEPNEEGNVKVSIPQSLEMVSLMSDLLPGYVSNMSGLKDAEGNPISIETVAEQTYFFTLAAEIIRELMMISTPKEADLGKSEEQPRESSTEETSTMTARSSDSPAQIG